MSGSGTAAAETGTVSDMVSRMRAVMPASWFPVTPDGASTSTTPNLDGLLAGVGWGWSYCYSMIRFVTCQARVSTATGNFLDMICEDFFGTAVCRQALESDDAFRSRILANLLVPRATRAAVVATIQVLTGCAPLIFEPSRAADTGGYGSVSLPGAGGGGGYGSIALCYGSSQMPFQYLVTVLESGGRTLRESVATFLDGEGVMHVAQRHVIRPAYSGGVLAGSLAEARSFNLIKDSIGWSTLLPSATSASVGWSVDPSGQGALLPGQPVLQISILEQGSISGPTVTTATGSGVLTASVWIMLPPNHGLTSLDLAICGSSSQVTVYGGGDVSITGRWQRMIATLPASASETQTVSMTIQGLSSGSLSVPVLTQCWQLEPGPVATSYIPTSHQIGVREADQAVVAGSGNPTTVNVASLNQAIRRAIPAGSVSWLTLAS